MSDSMCQPAYFINRELSWLEFDHRVMMEALNTHNPVFERMKFLAIACNNLDEFFMIRVASVRDQVQAGYNRPDHAGLKPYTQLKKMSTRIHTLMNAVYDIYRDHIVPALCREGIRILHPEELTREQRYQLGVYFEREVYSVLTPMAVDSSRPFPLLQNKSLHLGALLRSSDSDDDDEPSFATVQIPSVLPRLVPLPREPDDGGHDFILLEDVIKLNIARLFRGWEVLSCHAYRITRNADLDLDEEEAEDLLQEIKRSLRMRKWGAVIRLEIDENIDHRLLHILKREFEVEHNEIYYIDGPLNLVFLMKELYNLPGCDALRYPPYTPFLPDELRDTTSIFDAIKEREHLLYHPFDSFDPVVRFLDEAADDPDVLAIKQTLYRVSGHSPVVHALERAAESGKQVTALLEVKARFDEENNIQWGDRLEKAGCHVIYGLAGLKTHSKITLVVRREQDEIRRYIHLGTGNYNDVTAKIYSDYSFFTCDEEIGADATAFFNTLTGYSTPPEMSKLVSAPARLRPYLMHLIEGERQHALRGEPAEICAKMNALLDPDIIEALYAASTAGVKIRLIVRGICCLRPGIEGVSENIEIHSIVGRFLEHSRIYCFRGSGRSELYLSSADLMPRNLDRRVELLFPIEDAAIAARILDDFETYWRDTAQTSILAADGLYQRLEPDEERYFNAQESLIRAAETPESSLTARIDDADD